MARQVGAVIGGKEAEVFSKRRLGSRSTASPHTRTPAAYLSTQKYGVAASVFTATACRAQRARAVLVRPSCARAPRAAYAFIQRQQCASRRFQQKRGRHDMSLSMRE